MAIYISHLLDQRKKLRRVYSATLSHFSRTAKAKLIQDLASLATSELQEPEVPSLSLAFPLATKPLPLAEVNAPCPLDTEGLSKELCPLMKPIR
jgi:hypothetical protein